MSADGSSGKKTQSSFQTSLHGHRKRNLLLRTLGSIGSKPDLRRSPERQESCLRGLGGVGGLRDRSGTSDTRSVAGPMRASCNCQCAVCPYVRRQMNEIDGRVYTDARRQPSATAITTLQRRLPVSGTPPRRLPEAEKLEKVKLNPHLKARQTPNGGNRAAPLGKQSRMSSFERVRMTVD